jgi:cation diffusion facilitator family transporter
MDRKALTRKVTVVGMLVNLGLIGFKITAGLLGHSQAVFADGIHSASDLLTDLMILVGLAFWARPRDIDHPYGHERIETLLTLVLSVILLGAGLFLAYEAIIRMLRRHTASIGMIALYAALVSVAVKETLYRWTRRMGAEMKSIAVAANAWHHRSDALSSLPVATAVLAALIFPGLWFVDQLGAILVSLFIMGTSYKIALPCVKQLIDTAPSREVQRLLVETIEATDGVVSAHGVKARYLGPKILGEAHIEVDGRVTVEEGHDIAEDAKRNVFNRFPEIEDMTIHVEPIGDYMLRGEP